jgi:hypothetical protein
MIEVHEAKEGLNIVDVSGFWPVKDYLDLVFIHLQPLCGALVTKELDCVLLLFTLLQLSVETVLS